MNNMLNNLTNKTIGWVDQIFGWAGQYSNLLIYGVVAMMVAKLAKLKINIGGGK
jgi:hypothetical protein